MELAPGGKHKYSFAVIAGMNAGEPLSTRAARMKNYNALVRELDSSGAHYSQELSEVDISDPEDVKVLPTDPNGEVLVHLGSANYLQRYKTYVTHVQQWRQQFDKLESVDLRYDGQIIVNPDLAGMARQPALTPAAAKAAVAAGVKTAAIVNYEKYVTPPAPLVQKKKEAKSTGKPSTKSAVHHPLAKSASAKPSRTKQAAAKPAPVKKAPVTQTAPNQSALRPATNTAPVAAAKPAAQQQPVTSTPPPVSTGQKKPSAAIPLPKETPQN
jgi:cell division protein FtsQ